MGQKAEDGGLMLCGDCIKKASSEWRDRRGTGAEAEDAVTARDNRERRTPRARLMDQLIQWE